LTEQFTVRFDTKYLANQISSSLFRNHTSIARPRYIATHCCYCLHQGNHRPIETPTTNSSQTTPTLDHSTFYVLHFAPVTLRPRNTDLPCPDTRMCRVLLSPYEPQRANEAKNVFMTQQATTTPLIISQTISIHSNIDSTVLNPSTEPTNSNPLTHPIFPFQSPFPIPTLVINHHHEQRCDVSTRHDTKKNRSPHYQKPMTAHKPPLKTPPI
jgi:hypothetical protein